MNPLEKLADLIINHSLTIEKEKRKFEVIDYKQMRKEEKSLHIMYEFPAEELAQLVKKKIFDMGGDVILENKPWFESSSVDREKVAACLTILSEPTTHSRANAPLVPQPVRHRPTKGGHMEVRTCRLVYPTETYARDAGMSLVEFEDYLWKAMLLDKEDPVNEWRKIYEEQDNFIYGKDGINGVLSKTKNITIVDENTDTRLTMSVEGHIWKPSYGRLNLPDNEIGNAPRKTSVNGEFMTEIPQCYEAGPEVSGIWLKFKDGRVIKRHADVGEDYLNKFFETHLGVNYLGEIGIGMNKRIDKITKLLIADEKMGGTIHIALGQAWPVHVPEGGDRLQLHEQSSQHWDLIKDMRDPGKYILTDQYKLTWNNTTRQWVPKKYTPD